MNKYRLQFQEMASVELFADEIQVDFGCLKIYLKGELVCAYAKDIWVSFRKVT